MSINERLDSIKLHLGSAYSKIQAKGGTLPVDKNISNLASAIETIEGGGGPSDVRLNAPTLSWGTSSTTVDELLIANTYNGNFVTSYDIYNGSVLLATIEANIERNSVNLRDYISQGGTYTIRVVAKGNGFLDSAAASIQYIYYSYASITNSLTNCTNNNSATTTKVGQPYNATLVATSGYSFIGATISIVMNSVDVTDSVYKGKGIIEIENVTGPIVITATFATITQLATPTLTLTESLVLSFTAVTNAESYNIYINGVVWRNVADNSSIDMSDILIIEGTYNFTVKALADGYLDSNESNQESYINSDGYVPSSTLGDNSWEIIRAVAELGLAPSYWSLGDTKSDLGVDGLTRTYQIVDMQGLYNKHIVFMQVNLETSTYQMDNTPSTSGDIVPYKDSKMRTVWLPSILLKYSVELQNQITDTTYITGHYLSKPNDVLTDKLFLAAQKEVSGTNPSPSEYKSGLPAEAAALTTFQYFANTYYGQDSLIRVKNKGSGSTPTTWWLRSITWDSFNSFKTVNASGNLYREAENRATYQGVAPCFSF